jgi:hypothetical protein
MKARLIIAMAFGAIISMIFLAIPSLTDGTSPRAYLELPGIVAALLVWGAHGEAVPTSWPWLLCGP